MIPFSRYVAQLTQDTHLVGNTNWNYCNNFGKIPKQTVWHWEPSDQTFDIRYGCKLGILAVGLLQAKETQTLMKHK